MTTEPLHTPRPRPSQPQARVEDWLAIPEEMRAELLHGRIVYHSMSGLPHGTVASGLAVPIRGGFHRRNGDAERPGGWWISQEVDLFIGGIGCRPDLLGWLRDKHPTMPKPDKRGVITDAPVWVCEVLSPSTAVHDMGVKRRAYHSAGVQWYWLADPEHRSLTVLRRTDDDYLIALVAGVGERVRAEPFASVEIDLSDVFDFGDEPVESDEPASP